jgi:hypothetical protein
MRALTLRRTGFAATLLTGLVLVGSAVHGLTGVNTTLEVAAATPDRAVFVAHHEPDRAWGDCDGRRDDRRRV